MTASRYASAGDAATSYQLQARYGYDAFGRRNYREVLSPTIAERERQLYVHDGFDIDMIEEQRPRPTLYATTRRTWYTLGGTDEMVALTDWDAATGVPAPASHYYSTDHQGTVRALHDDAGNVVADLDHDSYGNPQVTVEAVAQPYRFTGREWDRATGLYHYRAREYDPVTGRFLQEDPIWFDAGDMNVYRYTWNNPVMWRDPSGLSPAVEYGAHARTATVTTASQTLVANRLNCVFGGIASVLWVTNHAPRGVADAFDFNPSQCSALLKRVSKIRIKEIRTLAEKACRARSSNKKGDIGELVLEETLSLFKETFEAQARWDTKLGRLITDASYDKSTHVEVKVYPKRPPNLKSRKQARKYDLKEGAVLLDLCAGARNKRRSRGG